MPDRFTQLNVAQRPAFWRLALTASSDLLNDVILLILQDDAGVLQDDAGVLLLGLGRR